MSKSKRILWLSLAINGVEEPYSDLIEYAAQHSISIQTIQQYPPITATEFAELMEQADGFFLTFYDLLDQEAFREQIISEIKKGKRLLVLGPHIEFNQLLLEFDLAITEDRLCGPGPLFGDDRTVLVRHEDQTNSTARALLVGKVLTVSQPSRVWYGGTANPVFSVPGDSIIWSKDDFFEDPGPRHLCCGGLWTGDGDSRAGLLVLAGSVLGNPGQGFTGKFFPGIRANVPFLEQLLDWWVGDLVIEHTAGDAVDMLHKIECGLYDVMVHLLRQHFPNSPYDWWYHGVPETLRKKAAELHEESKGHIPKEQGFFFISYKIIIDHNWNIFATHFDPNNQGKKKALDWIQELNELRNRLSHPLRLREQPLTANEHSEIGNRNNFLEALRQTLLARK